MLHEGSIDDADILAIKTHLPLEKHRLLSPGRLGEAVAVCEAAPEKLRACDPQQQLHLFPAS